MQAIYLEVANATREEDLDDAADVLAGNLAGPAADALIGILLKFGKAGKNLAGGFGPRVGRPNVDVPEEVVNLDGIQAGIGGNGLPNLPNGGPIDIPPILAPTNRKGLRKAMGDPPPEMVNPNAHHDLSWNYKEWFASRGLDVNDPRFGRWVEGNPPGTNQTWSDKFDREWADFIRRNPQATEAKILDFMNQLRIDPRFQ